MDNVDKSSAAENIGLKMTHESEQWFIEPDLLGGGHDSEKQHMCTYSPDFLMQGMAAWQHSSLVTRDTRALQ